VGGYTYKLDREMRKSVLASTRTLERERGGWRTERTREGEKKWISILSVSEDKDFIFHPCI
jgi:hypothetical protein